MTLLVTGALALLVACAATPDREVWVEPVTGMRFVHLAPGRFVMGSPAGEPHREAQEVEHPVTLPHDLWLGESEVTQTQWLAVLADNPSWFEGSDHPIENITWNEARRFLEALTRRSPGQRFRLPTEAEWEYACRAGSRAPYASGASLTPRDANVARSTAEAAAAAAAGKGGTMPVRSFAPNAWGLFDMHGNVWEWTSDEHCPYPEGPVTDPHQACGSPLKVIRGGSWYFEADSARCGLRYTHPPGDRGFSLGLRVVREPVG